LRELVILVPDTQCEATLTGFFQRDGFHLSLGCRPFAFDPRQDLLRETRNDPGVWKNSHSLLRLRRSTHRNALIVLDNAWEGSPGVAKIEADIAGNMTACGWPREQFEVIVINPELESWIWQDHIHVEKAFGHASPPSLRQKLRDSNLWPDGSHKPTDPKAAVEMVQRWYGFGPPSPVFAEIAMKVSVKHCVDPAFQRMQDALRYWFPTKR
jgi:hypothetical protein